MLNRLLRLYNKQHQPNTSEVVEVEKRQSTPLEDFTTEALVGIFEHYPDTLDSFCRKKLGLKWESFSISTQQSFSIEYDKKHTFFIDIVIRGNKNEICFWENKVNSPEGKREVKINGKVVSKKQLDIYSGILESEKNKNSNLETYLVYCTKFTETKDEKRHSFKQIKWFQIADFLKKENKERKSDLITIFLNFLKEHKMNSDIDLKFSEKDISALENYSRLTDVIEQHIEWAENDFHNIFENKKDNFQKGRFDFYWKRYDYKKIKVIQGDGYSEIIYQITFDGRIGVNIFTANNSDVFKESATKYKEKFGYQLDENEKGICIYWAEDLSNFLNDEKGDEEINKWFKNTFKKVEEFIRFTEKEISWSI